MPPEHEKALIIQRFYSSRQEQFQQRVEEQFALLGDLPVLRGFFQIAFGQRFVQLRANDAFRQPGVVDEVGARRSFQQAEAVHEELERPIRRRYLMLLVHVVAAHKAARVLGLGGAQDAPSLKVTLPCAQPIPR